MVMSICLQDYQKIEVCKCKVLYNLWTCIAREAFPEIQSCCDTFWFIADVASDLIYMVDIAVQFRTGYLERGLIVYDTTKLALHYVRSRSFVLDLSSLVPLDYVLQPYIGTHPLIRFPRFLKFLVQTLFS